MKHLRHIVVFLLLVCAAFAQEPLDTVGRVDAAVRQFQSNTLAPAVTVAVAVNGKLTYSKAFGIADIENEVRATPETLIRTGSIAKPMAAAAALTLVDAGKLELDLPIQKYCPTFPQKPWVITTRELLGHLSGIRHYRGDEIASTKHYVSMSEAFEIFGNDPLLFEPGTKYSYTTYGFTVVGCVIEGSSGEKFADYVAQHVLRPAGMKHTFIDDVYSIVPHRARGYQKVQGRVENAGLMDSSYKLPGGGYVSTAEDLVRFQLAMMNDRIVKPATLARMWTSQSTTDGKLTHYGMGFGVLDVDGVHLVGHSGSQQGTSTAMMAVPSRHFAAAVMVNMEGVNAQSLVFSIMKIYDTPAPSMTR
ncbi:MAG: serine hydrolase domain-containing protein [Terriglobales bacterium]